MNTSKLHLEILDRGSVNEIAIQKAYTVGRRGEYRVYFDDLLDMKIIPVDDNKNLAKPKDVQKYLRGEVNKYLNPA